MNAKTRNQNPDRIRGALSMVWVGPVMGIACMIGLFCYAVANGSAPMMVVASSVAASMGAVWASTYAALRSQLAKAAKATKAAQ
ncbi:hypothetical protein [Tessaracoccus caeni]|uniref:hypothetical protein n=1 Tax=Tessaracoccus caeni TaxID=3031239 RepID=UPI0023DAEAA8|nr:hypothetical protein [Tessaracoccus caeni]MDF1488046.1 hypothetical protein [Tessaracoccus caeni]